MSDAFAVLALKQRRILLDALRERERSVGELVESLDWSQPAVSKQLRILRDAGLVQSQAVAQRRIYRVRVEPLVHVDDWLSPYRRLWRRHLDSFEKYLHDMSTDDQPL